MIEKLRNLESEAVAADTQRRRAIVDAALDGERKAKSEFAAASRKLATLFDSGSRCRQRKRIQPGQERRWRSASIQGQKKAAKEHAAKTKPIEDCARDGRRLSPTPGCFSPPEYRKFKLNPEATDARLAESYDRYTDPSDELFTRLARMEPPLKLLESLIIPKAMKGGREAWVFVFVILPLVGLAFTVGSEVNMTTMIGAAVVVGAALALLLRTWLLKLSQSQLESRYTPLMHALADADALTAHCRGLVDAAIKDERKKIAVRRDDELRRCEEAYRKAFAAAEAHRDEKLRKINEVYATRMVEVQTTQQRGMREAIEQHDRRLAELRVQVQTSLPRLDQKFKSLKEPVSARATAETAWRRDGQPMARRHESRGGRARCDQPRGRRLLPGVERRLLVRPRVARGRAPRASVGDGPARRKLASACRGERRPTPG